MLYDRQQLCQQKNPEAQQRAGGKDGGNQGISADRLYFAEFH